jgi:hypothetical protein
VTYTFGPAGESEGVTHVVEVGVVGGKRERAANVDIAQLQLASRPGGHDAAGLNPFGAVNFAARVRTHEVRRVFVA